MKQATFRAIIASEVRKAGGKVGPIKALRELGEPAAVLLGTKARVFAA